MSFSIETHLLDQQRIGLLANLLRHRLRTAELDASLLPNQLVVRLGAIRDLLVLGFQSSGLARLHALAIHQPTAKLILSTFELESECLSTKISLIMHRLVTCETGAEQSICTPKIMRLLDQLANWLEFDKSMLQPTAMLLIEYEPILAAQTVDYSSPATLTDRILH